MSADLSERLAACAMIKTRFQGRVALEREAERSPAALARLEAALGLLSAEAAADECLAAAIREARYQQGRQRLLVGLSLLNYEARREQARRWCAAPPTDEHANVARAIAPDVCAEIDAIRATRRVAPPGDPLATRKPGHAKRVITRRRARILCKCAHFRSAQWGQETTIHYVEPGMEGAWSGTESVRPSSVGASAAYCRKAFWVTTAQHKIRVSSAILSPAVRALQDKAPRGVLYLREDLRIVQGRGTSLVVQRRGPRGGWS